MMHLLTSYQFTAAAAAAVGGAGAGKIHCHHMAAINITEQAAAASFEVYNCHENHLLHLKMGAGGSQDHLQGVVETLPSRLHPAHIHNGLQSKP